MQFQVSIVHSLASNGRFLIFLSLFSEEQNTITIQRFQTFYLQVRGGDISGTRKKANKPVSVFSGHECAN